MIATFFDPLYSNLVFMFAIIVYCQTWFDLLFSLVLNWVLNIHTCMTVWLVPLNSTEKT